MNGKKNYCVVIKAILPKHILLTVILLSAIRLNVMAPRHVIECLVGGGGELRPQIKP